MPDFIEAVASQFPASESPWWTDGARAATELMGACLAQMERWAVTSRHAGGELPVPCVYGVPGQWPHVGALYEQAGFVHSGRKR
jgi:hypothetical protein